MILLKYCQITGFTFFNEHLDINNLPLHFTKKQIFIDMKGLSHWLLLGVIILASCSTKNNKLEGVWKVDDVKTEFDETRTTPQMLQQVADLQKQTHFKLLKDSVLVIISNNNTLEAVWMFDKKNDIISFHFKGDTALHQLGVYKEPYIVSKTNTMLGDITVTYAKE